MPTPLQPCCSFFCTLKFSQGFLLMSNISSQSKGTSHVSLSLWAWSPRTKAVNRRMQTMAPLGRKVVPKAEDQVKQNSKEHKQRSAVSTTPSLSPWRPPHAWVRLPSLLPAGPPTECLLHTSRSAVQSTSAILTSAKPGNSFLESSSQVGARFLQ